MRIKWMVLVLSLLAARFCLAQDSIPPEIRIQEKDDSLLFSARLRPLRQLAGAPAAFYSYFWELGDGRFSFDKDPVYAYRDTGTYQVRLYATNNYDDGKAPPTSPRPVKVRKKTVTKDAWVSHFFHGNGNIEVKINRYPRPGEDFVTVIGYRNQGGDSSGGSIVLFYNERQIGQESFALADRRYYNGEDNGSLQSLMASLDIKQAKPYLAGKGRGSGWTASAEAGGGATGEQESGFAGDVSIDNETAGFAGEASSILRSLEATYSQHTVLHFPSIKHGEEKFAFMEMNTLPGMLRDTNATVGITAMLVPDNIALSPEVYQMDMQVVASHDPNRILLKSRRINYRFWKQKKELLYRIQFQNTGNGPAKKIAVGVAIPRQLDPGSVELKAMSPVCSRCDPVHNQQSCIDTICGNDSIYFVFNNIYLPGLSQEGVKDQDSTMGFVEYAIRFVKKPRKIPFSTRAAIVFDQNQPVVTNKATARFIKGLSPGIMAGYSLLPSNGSYSARGPLQFGYVLAPYAPSRPYFQIEFFVGLLQQDDFAGAVVQNQRDTTVSGIVYAYQGHQTTTTLRRNSFEFTPLHYRYNIGKWVGLGLGAMVQVNISEQTTTVTTDYLSTQQLPPVMAGGTIGTGGAGSTISSAVNNTTSAVTYLGNWNAAPFADVQIGRIRSGPVIGARYIRLLKGDIPNRIFFYAGFKL